MTASRRLTFKFMAFLVAGYLLLLAPGLIWPGWFETPVRFLLLAPYLSVFLFDKLGVPGLLEHDGLCGWGWCSPTPFGLVFTAIAWLLAAWLLAWLLAVVSSKYKDRLARGRD